MAGTLRSGVLITSAEIDGPADESDWGHWIRTGHAPPVGDISVADRVDDLTLLSELGLSEVVLTLEWARLEPRPGELHLPEVERLRALFEKAQALDLAPVACLVDGTLPGWFAIDERGFSDERARQLLWPRHVERMGETFGDLVNGWLPIREGIHHSIRNHWLAMGPPGRHDAEATAKAIQATVLANGEAWRVLAGSAPVALCETARLFIADSDNVKAEAHVETLDNWYRQSWTMAVADGQLAVEGLPPMNVPHLRNAFDRWVIQVRPAVGIDGDGRWSPCDPGFLLEGLATAADQTVTDLREGPTTIAADLAPVADEKMAAEHLNELRAIAGELGATSWWQTSPIDGWHWERGVDGLGGIVDAARTPREAAGLFAAG